MKLTIEEAKKRLTIPQLAKLLGIAGEIPERDGKAVRCWFPERHTHGDRDGSFNVFDGGTEANCFSCGIQFDAPKLVSIVLGLSQAEGFKRFLEMAGSEQMSDPATISRKKLRLPDDLSFGTREDWETVATGRRLDVCAVHLAVELGVLRFGTVCGFRSWIILDESRKVAEARRLDGTRFPKVGTLSERKAHTLAGSLKSWPAGIRTTHPKPEEFHKILVCEGGPDLLAAYHFLYVFGAMDALPVSILGRANRAIHSEALRLFNDRSVRIYPHNDDDGGGMKAAQRWQREIYSAGALKIDGFSFEGLARRDGKPVSDLNDCTIISPQDQTKLEGLLP